MNVDTDFSKRFDVFTNKIDKLQTQIDHMKQDQENFTSYIIQQHKDDFTKLSNKVRALVHF